MSKALLNRRREMMQKAGGFRIPYIQDGLVHMWDCDSFTDGSTQWIDSISGLIATSTEAIYKDTDGGLLLPYKGFNFSDGVPDSADVLTIEFAHILYPNSFNNATWGIFGYGFDAMVGGNYETYLCRDGGENSFQYKVPRNVKQTISLSQDLCIYNGDTKSKRGQNASRVAYYGIGDLYPTAFAEYYRYNGKIYNIRTYSRVLTQEEVLHNQQVDNERFNLGL